MKINKDFKYNIDDFNPDNFDTSIGDTIYKITLDIREQQDRLIQATAKKILYDLYFLDCNRKCNYDKMTAEEVVKEYNEALNKIQKEFNLSDYYMFHYDGYHEEAD